MDTEQESEPVGTKGQCPCDDPSQAFQLYDDGHGYCHAGGCPHPYWSAKKLAGAGWEVDPEHVEYHSTPRSRPQMSDEVKAMIEGSDHNAIQTWNLSQATARHWDYRTRIAPNGHKQHLAVYRDPKTREILDIKVRDTGTDGKDKKFFWASGSAPSGLLYGAHLLPAKGKMVVVAMGEKDALTVSQLWANKFPVVSPSNGEKSLKKDIGANLEQLLQFEKVVFVPDSDPAGFKAVEAAARTLPPGRAYIARLPLNDANDMHMAGRDEQLISLIHNAPAHRPDGIVSADDLDAVVLNPIVRGAPFAFEFLTGWTYGKRPGEVIVNGSGTGMGKTDFTAEDVANEIRPKEDGGNFNPVAVFNYEAGAAGTYKSILGKLWNRRFHIPAPEDGSENIYWTEDELRAASAYRREKCAKLFINDHFGAVDWDSVKERLRYLKHSEGIVGAYIDPMAALVSQEDDDRKALDRLMAEAKSLAEELGIWLWFNSHLTRPSQGPSHEEGGRVELKQFRGSNAISMWASFVTGMERNQQAEDEEERKTVTIRMLKDRFTGDSTGRTHRLTYNQLSGRYEEFASKMPEYEAPAEAPPETAASKAAQ